MMERRDFFRSSAAFAAAVVSTGGAAVLGDVTPAAADEAASVGPYGSIDDAAPDENGLLLPAGFRSRVVAVGGEAVAGTGATWHPFPDGGACFAAADGGWTYVSNSEVAAYGKGGVQALDFGPGGEIRGLRRICSGTTMNCAGGATPWGTWLTGEEYLHGLVWECDPTGARAAVARPALGTFTHEAAAVDPSTGAVYLTEDHVTGLLYRFTPTVRGDLASGVLRAAAVDDDGAVRWVTVHDPGSTAGAAQDSAPGATRWNGGEGVCVAARTLVFTTKGTGQVHAIDLDSMRYRVLREAGPPLGGVDNVTADPVAGDLYVAEDADNMELVLLSAEGLTVPFCRVLGHDGSEIAGPAFSPDRSRLYFSSQRGPTPKTIRDVVPELDADTRLGITYEVTGPFRAAPTPAPAPAGRARIVDRSGTDPGSPSTSTTPMTITLGSGAFALAVGGAVALRRRRNAS